MVSIYDLGCALSELNEEGTCEHLSESTDSKMRDIYDYVCDPTEPNTEVVYDYPTGVVNGEDNIATRRVERSLNPVYVTLNIHIPTVRK